MKHRDCDRPGLVLLALDALDAGASAELRRHLAGCPDCRAYLDEIASVCARQSASAQDLSGASLSDRVLHRVRNTVRSEGMPGPIAPWSWRRWMGVPAPVWYAGAAAVVAVVVVALLTLVPPGEGPSPGSSAGLPAAESPLTSTASPPAERSSRLLTYRQAINRSDAELERLLAVRGAGGASSEAGDRTRRYRMGWSGAEQDL